MKAIEFVFSVFLFFGLLLFMPSAQVNCSGPLPMTYQLTGVYWLIGSPAGLIIGLIILFGALLIPLGYVMERSEAKV